MRRTFVKTLVGVAVAAAFSGVAMAQQGKPVKIGLLATLEGPFAAGGADGMRGAELAIKERKGVVAGRKIELIKASSDAKVGSSRVDLQACKLEYSIVSPK